MHFSRVSSGCEVWSPFPALLPSSAAPAAAHAPGSILQPAAQPASPDPPHPLSTNILGKKKKKKKDETS